LNGRHFSSDVEVIVAAETWLDGQHSDFFFEWLAIVHQPSEESQEQKKVSVSKKTHCCCITNSNKWTHFRVNLGVCCEKHAEYRNRLYGQKGELVLLQQFSYHAV
jgi:hypothetical protein